MTVGSEEMLGHKPDFWEIGFKDKIKRADFNEEPEHALSPEEFEIGNEFVHYQNLPPEGTQITAIIGPGTSKSIDLLNYWKRVKGLKKYADDHPKARIVMPSGKRPTAKRATADEMAEGFSEAKIMEDELVGLGLDRSRIQREDEATHTGENIEFSLNKLFGGLIPLDTNEPINLMIVTSSYCGRRTDLYMKRELRKRKLEGKVKFYLYDADVQEDIDRKEGKITTPLTPEEEKLKLVTELREMLRLDLYADKGDLPRK